MAAAELYGGHVIGHGRYGGYGSVHGPIYVGYRGKRSAAAEPDAKAYGGYGGYGYGGQRGVG